MTNAASVVGRKVGAYFKSLKYTPGAQYVTKTSAASVAPSLTTLPPPAYYGQGARPVSSSSSLEEWLEKPEKPSPVVSQVGDAQPKKGGGIFDAVVRSAGSRWAFLFTLCLLGVWAVLGIVYGATDTWQVIFQDTSSIQCYMSATLLMRQQQNSTRSLLTTICEMISRSQGNARMMRQLTPEQRAKLKRSQRRMRSDLTSALEMKEGAFDKLANGVSKALGSLWALVFYWSGILVWVFFGIPLMWSDTWQLYVNTATALELTFTTMFLQNVRRQHEDYLGRCLHSIDTVDRDLERELRRMTGDMAPNPVVESQPPTLSRIEKAIDFWAFIVGGSIGVMLSVAVAVAWASVGSAMEFDDNWWLIIGTYTGLMGFIDGFVLRNVHHRETVMADRHFALLAAQDARLFDLIDVPFPADKAEKAPGRAARISARIGHMVETQYASVVGVAIVVALLAIASGYQWTETGQLLCNTPTMIVEGFLLLMLIQGHNAAESQRRAQYTDILARRMLLDHRVSAWEDDDYALDVKLLEEKKSMHVHVLSVSEKYRYTM